MKRLLPILLIIVIVSCDKVDQQKVTTIFAGHIKNPLDNRIRIINGDLLFVDTLDQEGNFNIEVEIDQPTYFRLRHGEYSDLYIRPGDSLYMTLDTDQFDETITYSGEGAELSQFKADMILYNDSTIDYTELYSLDENPFLDKINEIQKQYLALIDAKGIDDKEFIASENIISELKKGQLLFSYEDRHKNYQELDSFSVSEGFFDGLKNIDVNNPELLGLLEFKAYIDAFIDSKIIQGYESLENPDESDYYRLVMEGIEKNVENPSVKEYLHFSNLNSYAFTYAEEDTRIKWVSYYESLNPDTVKLAIIHGRQLKMDSLNAGNVAPVFKYESINGEFVSLEDLRGSLVYVDVWATWCRPCLQELPDLEKLQEDFKDTNIKFVSVSIDNTPEPWRKMVVEKEMKGIQLYAEGAWNSDIIKNYMIGGIPRFMLIDSEGKIIDATAARPSDGVEVTISELLKNI